MNSIEEGCTSATVIQPSPHGPTLVEQPYMPPANSPNLKAFLGDPTPLYVPSCNCIFPAILHSSNELICTSGIMGFILALTPFACELMEFRGSFGAGAATVWVKPQFSFGLLTD